MKRTLLLLFALVLAVVAGTSCARLLGVRPAEATAFPHHAHTNKGINCRECHGDMAKVGETGPLHIPDTAACVKCHQKPHDPNTCANCHGLPYVRANAELARENLHFEHKKHLAKNHGECVHCHSGVQRDADRIRPSMAVCLGCHEHQDQFTTRKCDNCHEDIQGEHVMPTSHVVHEGDWLREHGTRAASSRDLCSTCHQDKMCASCHGVTVPILPEKLHFDDPLRAGMHRAGFKSRHSLEARANPGLCSTCHEPAKFCDSCHAEKKIRAADNGRSPHPAGWLGLRGESNDHGRAAWRDPMACAACHSGQGEQMCVGCHRVGAIGGNPHRPGWRSTKQPRVDMPCRLCHAGP
jgi:hypothetical protein